MASMGTVRSNDGTTIAFDRSGEGPPVILVGGAFQHRAIDPRTARLAELLASRYTVYHYDRRGRGDSGDTPPYAVAREVDDLDALIGEAGGSASVFGMSSGAALALEAAAHGLTIAKLALYEPPYMVSDRGPRPPADHAAQLAELVAAGRRGDAVAFFMTQLIGLPAEAVASIRNAPMWPGLEAVAHTLVYDAAVMGDYSLPTERLASVTAPTLVIDGEESDERLRRAVQAVADILPHAQRRTLAGQTHDYAAEALAPVLEEFFAG